MACFGRLGVELYKRLGSRNMPLPGNIVILGSAAMRLQGIEREIADVDMFASREAWDVLKDGGWRVVPDLDPPPMLEWNGCAIPVHCWYETYTRFIDNDSSPRTTFERAHIVNGWPVMDLGQLMEWKLEADRPKDRRDVDLIAAHLATGVRA